MQNLLCFTYLLKHKKAWSSASNFIFKCSLVRYKLQHITATRGISDPLNQCFYCCHDHKCNRYCRHHQTGYRGPLKKWCYCCHHRLFKKKEKQSWNMQILGQFHWSRTVIMYHTYLHHHHQQEHKLSALNELAGVVWADDHDQDEGGREKHC